MASTELADRGVVVASPAGGQKNRLAYEQLDHAVRCTRCKQELSAPPAFAAQAVTAR